MQHCRAALRAGPLRAHLCAVLGLGALERGLQQLQEGLLGGLHRDQAADLRTS
jgi:hypothetical protein